MDKKTIAGIVVMAAIFLGFALLNNREQQRYKAQMEAYQAYQDSVKRAEQALLPAADTLSAAVVETATASAPTPTVVPTDAARLRQVALYGEELVAAREKESDELTVENDLLKVRFSTRGGRIAGVTLKEYTKYAPKDERTEPVELFDPEAERFALSFYLRNGLNDVLLSTADYTFETEPVRREADGTQVVTMRLPVAEGAALEYRYLIYNTAAAARDYLIDFQVRLIGLRERLSNQTSIGLEWSSLTYQNERGFDNENMYTTIAYRFPDEDSIEELSMSKDTKTKEVSTKVSWVDFKQQFFSSVLIAPDLLSGAKMGFETAPEGSGYMKRFTLQSAVEYAPSVDRYDFAFYFGPNYYPVLRKVTVADEKLHLERVIPLGWGIFGWINRWVVIPVFDLLRNHIAAFGVIILILAVMIRLIISPLTYKSYVSMAKMRLIKPEVDALAQKFPKQEDAMKRQQATMELYRKAGINPMGGCIPMLIQVPILIAMFRFFPASIELRGESFLWASDLSSYDSIWQLPFTIPFYGDHVSLFALLMAVSSFVYSYVTYQQSASSQPQMAGMKFMMLYLMPLMLLCWFNSYASGLCYYYLLSNLLTIGQTYVVRRMVDDDKIRLAMEANAAKKSKGKKSKFQQRYEELMRQQELQQRGKKR